MSAGLEFATVLKTTLESIADWTGRVYIYIPPIKKEVDIASYLTPTSASTRIDAWFINRTSVNTRVYGEARYEIHARQRAKIHRYQIKGFQSVVEDTGSGQTSEEDFQDLCDTVEATITPNISLGITNRTVYLRDFGIDIDFQSFGSVLCHTAIVTLNVVEYKATTYS